MVFTILFSFVSLHANAASSGYNLTFDSNGGDDFGKIVWKNKTYSRVLNIYPQREGYICLGWSIDPNATVAEYLDGDYISISEDTTLYAVWAEVPTIEIVNNPGTVTLDYGDELIITAKTSELPEGIVLNWTSLAATKVYREGNTCKITAKGTDDPITVQLRLLYEKNGKEVYYNGITMFEEQKIEFNFDFWARFVSFFKDLFMVDRRIYQ